MFEIVAFIEQKETMTMAIYIKYMLTFTLIRRLWETTHIIIIQNKTLDFIGPEQVRRRETTVKSTY